MTDIITQYDRYFITKCDRSLLQNVTEVYYKMRQVFLFQNATVLLQNASYYKMQQFYYKMRQLLQNVTFITNCDSTMRKVAAVSLDESTILNL